MLGQALTEQVLHTPLCFFPAYYIFKEWSLGDPAKRQGHGVCRTALTRYRTNFFQDMMADIAIWMPSHFINFTFMPMHMRVPWVATTSFFYAMVLSGMRGGDKNILERRTTDGLRRLPAHDQET